VGKFLQPAPPGGSFSRPESRRRSRRRATGRGRGAWICALLVWAFSTGADAAQGQSDLDAVFYQTETEYHLVNAGTTSLALAHGFIETGSVRTEVDGELWRRDVDYRVRAREGVWVPLQPFAADADRPSLLVVTYRFRPAPVRPRQDLHPVVTQLEIGKPSENAPPPAARAAVEAGYGEGLSVRGSKSIRVAQGNRRELTVDQTLRLTISGQLTRDITVAASLSDDNLPVVPEGNTEELRDVDKVLVELRAKRWEATLGDLVVERSGTVFGNYRRKLQGASITTRPNMLSFDGMAGAPRGVYRTLQIRGQESNQGPYRLGGGEVGGSLFIVAGSERVTLDGEVLTRGTDRDYVIDYVQGTITFTYRRLITAESLIVVEFEQGEGPYVRTMVGGGGQAAFRLPLGAGLPGTIGVRTLRERDDPQRLRTGELKDADLQALAAAGDDPDRAIAPGVSLAEPGRGQYGMTVVEGDTVFRYDPAAGEYLLDFFYAGTGAGDYGVDSLTVAGERVYGFKGTNQGSYRIGRPLPLPDSQSLVTASTELGDPQGTHLRGEWNLSVLDRNELSSRDDADNEGQAWVLAGATGKGRVFLGGRELGEASLQGRHESRNSRFRPLLLQKDLFTYDRWGLGDRARRPGFLEQSDAESSLLGQWSARAERRQLELAAEYGQLEHGGTLNADRWRLDANWRWRGGRGRSEWEKATSEDQGDPLDITRRRSLQQASWNCAWVVPKAQLQREQWRDTAGAAGVGTGYRLRRWGYGLAAAPGSSWLWEVGWERGLADSLRAGAWRLERDSRTSRVDLSSPMFAGMRMVAKGTLRDVFGETGKRQTTRLGRLDLSGRWDPAGSDWSLGYGVDNSRSEVLDRQVVFAGERQGDYNETGEFVGRNQGDFNVVLVGTDSLVATTAVEADLTWRQDFGFLGRRVVWGSWSTLTQLAAKGRSRSDNVGRLLRLEPAALFHDNDAVLGEVNLRQEAAFLKHVRWLDLRFRYDYDEARDRQYLAHPEDRLKRTYLVTVTWNATATSSLQLRGEHRGEIRLTGEEGAASRRSYDTAAEDVEAEWAWRPSPGNRLATALERVRRRDDLSGVRQLELAVRPSVRYRLDRRWSAQAEFRWAEVESDEPAGAVRPFFFPLGGSNIEANARVSWDPTAQLSVAAVYFGRRLGERGWQHDVRLESTARF
jgi:hypothetical protein